MSILRVYILYCLAAVILLNPVRAVAEDRAAPGEAWKTLYRENKIDLLITIPGKIGGLEVTMPQRYAEVIANIKGVKEVIPLLVEVGVIDGAAFAVTGAIPESSVFDHYRIKVGRNLKRTDGANALVGEKLAKKLMANVGDTIEAFGEQWTTVGIFETQNVIESEAMIVPLEQLQACSALSRPGEPSVTGFFIKLSEPYDDAARLTVQNGIRELFSMLSQENGRLKKVSVQSFKDSVERSQNESES